MIKIFQDFIPIDVKNFSGDSYIVEDSELKEEVCCNTSEKCDYIENIDDEDCDDDGPETTAPATASKKAHATTSVTANKGHATASATANKGPPTALPTTNVRGGHITFFYQKGNPGACGTVHSDQDMIAAMDEIRFGKKANASPLCGQQVNITNLDNGKHVLVKIVDDCPTCINNASIDLSVAAFNQLSNPSVGRLDNVVWSFTH